MRSASRARATFGASRIVELRHVQVDFRKGHVTEFAFINPHSAIHLEAKDDKGAVEQWLVEADSPNNLGPRRLDA